MSLKKTRKIQNLRDSRINFRTTKQSILRAFGEMTSLGNRNDTSATSSEKESPTILKQFSIRN